MVGLFDRPASADCLRALRGEPVIAGLTNRLVALDDASWQRAVARRRAVRLLLPVDQPRRERSTRIRWCANGLVSGCGTRMRPLGGKRMPALRASARYDEGRRVADLADLAPLYRRHLIVLRWPLQKALDEVFGHAFAGATDYRGNEFYAIKKLGAIGNDLAAVSWFF